MGPFGDALLWPYYNPHTVWINTWITNKGKEWCTDRPRAAFLSCLHLYKLSPNLRRRT